MSVKTRTLGQSAGLVLGLLAVTFIGGAVIGYLEASGAAINVGAASF